MQDERNSAPAPGPVVIEKLARTTSLPPSACLIWGLWFGLAAGYLDLAALLFKHDLLHATPYYEQGKNFYWTIPSAVLAIMMLAGVVLAGIYLIWPAMMSLRSALWLFTTLAFWGPLLRAPIHSAASLLLAAGAARFVSRGIASHATGFQRFARWSLFLLVPLFCATAVVSLKRQTFAEARAAATLPAPPQGASNVLLIVMDTVRADSLGLYGYKRDTTPRLARWATRGVLFDWAFAPAPWTFPSHASFLTGQWPGALGAHWGPVLDPSHPTLAEFLASRGYLTSGFVANTFWCSYESQMDRGFAHFEDYPLAPVTILGSAALGRWALENVWAPGGYFGVKWVRAQSRDAGGINRSFLDWLARSRRAGRPFFAFLNYLDAHEPFLVPPAESGNFGLRPVSSSDSKLLLDYWDADKLKLSERDVNLAHDAYDDCIVALDRRLGALLDELDGRGMLRDTVVIITSDHGEQFGEHGVFNHGFSLYLHEVHVPLLIIAPTGPAGRRVTAPVSLRDLPATVVDLAGAPANSPFPGRSLADNWRPRAPAIEAQSTPAYSEVDIPVVIGPERGTGPPQRGFTVSLAAQNFHYLLDVNGTEELYDLAADPEERRNLKNDLAHGAALGRFRSRLAQLLDDNRVQSGTAADYQQRIRRLLESFAERPPG